MIIWVLIIVAVSLAITLVILFNNIVRKKFLVKEAYSGIEVQLKKRHDLIPNIVDITKGYMQYEQKVLKDVVTLRSEAIKPHTVNEKGSLESEISQSLKNIIAIAENYPDLKTNNNFLELHKALVDIEDQLQFARRYYNGAVRDYNIAIESFPALIVASLTNFKPAEFFEIEYATERITPDVKLP